MKRRRREACDERTTVLRSAPLTHASTVHCEELRMWFSMSPAVPPNNPLLNRSRTVGKFSTFLETAFPRLERGPPHINQNFAINVSNICVSCFAVRNRQIPVSYIAFASTYNPCFPSNVNHESVSSFNLYGNVSSADQSMFLVPLCLASTFRNKTRPLFLRSSLPPSPSSSNITHQELLPDHDALTS